MSVTDSTSKVLQALRRQGGVLSSAELQELLGISQPSVSRALAPLLVGGQVRKVGAARTQRYVLARQVAGVGSDIALVRIDGHGQPSPFGHMIALAGGGFWVDEADGVSERHDGLPWFLDDMRPQGFIGRTFAHNHPTLQLGTDPRQWSEDDVLRALTQFGEDLPGNLVVGASAFARWHSLPARTQHADSAADYPALAQRALQGADAGSSAGGEQPKFCCRSGGRSVIVKFSPAGDSAAEERIRDLLICEHLALTTLAEAGVPAARTALFIDAGRVFLESERFDRTTTLNAQGLPGRIGMVSLQVLNAQYIGAIDNWAASALRLQARGLISATDAQHLCLLEAYGQLIANTDRHYGNISFVLQDDDWALSPTYDMLPMLYMPIHSEIVPRDFAAAPPQPGPATLAVWPRAQQLAGAFWRRAAQDTRISAGFRALAAANADMTQESSR